MKQEYVGVQLSARHTNDGGSRSQRVAGTSTYGAVCATHRDEGILNVVAPAICWLLDGPFGSPAGQVLQLDPLEWRTWVIVVIEVGDCQR